MVHIINYHDIVFALTAFIMYSRDTIITTQDTGREKLKHFNTKIHLTKNYYIIKIKKYQRVEEENARNILIDLPLIWWSIITSFTVFMFKLDSNLWNIR